MYDVLSTQVQVHRDVDTCYVCADMLIWKALVSGKVQLVISLQMRLHCSREKIRNYCVFCFQ